MKLVYQFGGNDYVSPTEFEYEVEWKELSIAFEKIFRELAKVKKNECEPVERLLNALIDDADVWGIEQLQEHFIDDLKEYFMEDAFEAYYESEGYYDGSDDYYSDKAIK
jgi:hypothetical protein